MKEPQSSFFEDVYAVVRLIPEGRVTSYGAIAQYLGAKGKSRMVGWAMHGAVESKGVPAHRVVNRNGELTGQIHFGGQRMQELLEQEAIEISGNRIKNFREVFWDPNQELAL